MELFNTAYELIQPNSGSIILVLALFVRLSVFFFVLPGLGETAISPRIRIVVALVVTWLVLPSLVGQGVDFNPTPANVGVLFLIESIYGLTLGFSIRLMVYLLQIAGTIIAQALSLSQVFGNALTEDANPTISLLLVMSGLTLALTMDLHIEAIKMLLGSFDIFPLGAPINTDNLAYWATNRAMETFSFALSLSLPFVVLNFIYNLLLGVINKAMPQLMVSFVGMPAITGAGLVLLAITVGGLLMVWVTGFERVFMDFWSG